MYSKKDYRERSNANNCQKQTQAFCNKVQQLNSVLLFSVFVPCESFYAENFNKSVVMLSVQRVAKNVEDFAFILGMTMLSTISRLACKTKI